MPQKGIRQQRLCKFCGKPAKQVYDKHGRFKGYRKTCGECNPHTWTEESKKKLSQTITGLGHPKAKPLFTRRIQEKSPGLFYCEIKIKPGGRWMLEHRYIMEQHLGRKLRPNEHVHHKDGNTLNNDIDNLVLLTNREHGKINGFMLKKENKGLWNKSKQHKCPICGHKHAWPTDDE